MIIGVPYEILSREKRVALVPDVVKKLIKNNIKVIIEHNAGIRANYSDEQFIKSGATIVATKDELFKQSNIICAINLLNLNKITITNKLLYISFVNFLKDKQIIKQINNKNIQILAMNMVPRISRAQSMDALSSQANLAGYKSVILSSHKLNTIFPMLMTAAGTISPIKLLVLGAGVAGLQAIATAKRLGAIVYGYDVRAAVKEQIESLGGKFVNINIQESGEGKGGYAKTLNKESQTLQQEKLGEFASKMNVIISTAQIPGLKAPRLLNISAIKNMNPGSIVIDLATESGGNIEGSKANEEVIMNGVKIIGPTDLPSTLSKNASDMYAHNIFALLNILINKDNKSFNVDDEIITTSCIINNNVINKNILKFI